MRSNLALLLTTVTAALACGARSTAAADPQYSAEGITIPAATADEPIRKQFSLEAAQNYLEQGALAWKRSRNCIACHTTGTYVQLRPSLSPVLGTPPQELREFLVEQVNEAHGTSIDELKKGIKPTEVAYMAHGMAEWDAHVAGKLSPETRSALSLLLKLQSADGSWGNTTCWPPFESSNYQAATVAALAIAAAPGFTRDLTPEQSQVVAKLVKYLQTQPAPHDYGRLLLLWTSNHMPKLLSTEQRQAIIEMLWSHQQPDGGWSIRTFSTPEKWGGGNRAQKLRAETEFKQPPSDGHQTGLVVFVLRQANVPATDPRIQRAVQWLKSNQRQSGRWWTRSLNTDNYHFITYSGTFYPLLALYHCNAITTVSQNK